MSRFILSILAVLFPLQLLGQLFPLSDHYVYDALSINPAFAGANEALSATMMYRNQWVGFKDAPKDYMLTVHTPVLNDRIGLGFVIEENSIGIFKETTFLGNYAYRMEEGDGKLSLGLGFGVTVYNTAWNELEATDPNDAQLMNSPTTNLLPAFSLGTYYYTKKYFIGISIPLFLSYEFDKTTGKYKVTNNLSGYNYLFTGGYELPICSILKFMPSMLIKYHPNNTLQIDYNAQLVLKDKIWLGIGYRNRDMLVGLFQCQISYQLRIAYSYDFNVSDLGKYENGSHEIVLNYVFRYSRKVVGPRQF
jgi:type IX secretion system PorP/SprF family membrane protein